MERRIPYLQNQPGLDTRHDLIVKKRGDGERRIKSGKWWINRRTPVGEDAEIVERMPHRGRRIIEYTAVIATVETTNDK